MMGHLAGPVWAVLSVFAFLGVVGVLHALASALKGEEDMAELKRKAAGIRQEQSERVARHNQVVEAIPIEELGKAA